MLPLLGPGKLRDALAQVEGSASARQRMTMTISIKGRRTHPGEMIASVIKEDMRLSVAEAADQLLVSEEELQAAPSCKAPITPELAERVGEFLAMAPTSGCGCRRPTMPPNVAKTADGQDGASSSHACSDELRRERRDHRVAVSGAHSLHSRGKPINQRHSSGFNSPGPRVSWYRFMLVPEAKAAASSKRPLYFFPVRPPPPTRGVGHPI